ncbi:MAG: chromosome segregation protein SMC, partial [Phaeodactylibacter sp.]|nr:chromosome segregation protein SMC [Phaeodactylibacter sp.]
KGKANFFILDAFKDYSPPMTVLPNTTQAVDLVEVDPGYYNLVSYLLENVLVTEKEELLDQMANSQVVLLTRSGRFIQKKYSLAGGSVGLFEGKKIGRKKNLEILEKNIQKTEKESNQLSTRFYSLREQVTELKTKDHQQSIKELTKRVNQIAQEKVSLSTRLENYESLIGESSIKQAALKLQIKELEGQNQSIDKSLQENAERIKAVKDRISNTDGQYRDIAERLSAASGDYNQKNIDFIKQQNMVNTLQRELAFRERQLDEILSNQQQHQRKQEETVEQMEAHQQTIIDLTEGLHQAYQEKKIKEANLSEAEQSYFQARGGINELDDEIRKINKKRNDLQLIINELKDKFNTLKFEMTALGDRLNVEFGIHINELINLTPKEGLNEPELQEQVVRLKNRLDNYGEINPMAVEAYDEMKERYDTILTQKVDIEAAKEALLETIKEIEET